MEFGRKVNKHHPFQPAETRAQTAAFNSLEFPAQAVQNIVLYLPSQDGASAVHVTETIQQTIHGRGTRERKEERAKTVFDFLWFMSSDVFQNLLIAFPGLFIIFSADFSATCCSTG